MSELNNDTNVVQSTTNEQVYKELVFKTQEEFDNYHASLIRKGEQKALKRAKVEDGEASLTKAEYDKLYRKDLEASIRAEIERQAKLTESQKLAEEKQKMEEIFRQEKIEINKDKARVLLEKAGFQEEELEVYLDFVNEDREVSLGKIMRVCESHKNNEDRLLTKWQNELQASNPKINVGNSTNGITKEMAKNMSFKERVELKVNNPSLYETLFK